MNKLTLWLTVGAPASGKSTWSKKFVEENPSIVRYCPDELRAVFGKNEGDQTVSSVAFEAARSGLNSSLQEGKSVLIDATGMHRKARKQFLEIAEKHGAETHAVVFEVDREELLKRNRKRSEAAGRFVPEFVIDNMLSRYEKPEVPEFDVVTFIN